MRKGKKEEREEEGKGSKDKLTAVCVSSSFKLEILGFSTCVRVCVHEYMTEE